MKLCDIEDANKYAESLKEAEKAFLDFSGLHEKRETKIAIQSNQQTYIISCSREMLIVLANSAIENSVKMLEEYGVTTELINKVEKQ